MDDAVLKLYERKSIQEDWVDLRDQHYAPNLSVLRNECYIYDKLMDVQDGRKTLRFGIRDQGTSGRCAGFALANLIDIQRALQFERRRKINGQTDAQKEEQRNNFYNEIVSADMLYRMAYFHDRYPDFEKEEYEKAKAGKGGAVPEGVRTLRSAIKGFYHHGVCLDWASATEPCPPHCWQSDAYLGDDLRPPQRFPEVEQAKAARNIGLGAYYRLASVLNHFHAALNDAEAILASARVHQGWADPFKPGSEGIIGWDDQWDRPGAHAFVIVGYDDLGFHVLNSWGEQWGGYKGQAGIGLWTYGDWARNIVDAWVLRLGVYAPTAFGASVGEKGTKGLYAVQSGSTPCFELVGHYIHLDDGFHVQTGAYPSFQNGWEKTRTYLKSNLEGKTKDEPYKGILIWIPGSLEGIKQAFSEAVKRKNQVKALGLYPYSVFWCNGFAEKSMQVLQGLFDSCKEQAGEDGKHLDELIENRVRGVGRAFWRDIELSARRAVAGPTELPYEKDQDADNYFEPGFVTEFLSDLFQFAKDTGAEIHLVTEGAGVLVLHEILDCIEADAKKPKSKQNFPCHNPEEIFTSLHLVGPAIGLYRAGKKILRFLDKLNASAETKQRHNKTERESAIRSLEPLKAPAPAQVYIPGEDLSRRICFGAYSKSILHLVANAFEDRYKISGKTNEEETPPFGTARTFLGMSNIIDDRFIATEENEGYAERIPTNARLGITQIHALSDETHALDRIQQQVFDKNPDIQTHIFESILAQRAAKDKKGD